jgi:hypothetical protein
MEAFFATLALLAIMLVCMAYVKYARTRNEGFQTVSTNATANGLSLKPTLWWFVDDETNARHWWDFGARNSHKPNRGYLEVALQAAYATQAFDFQVVPLIGRAAVSKVIKEAGEPMPSNVSQLPAKIWRQWAMANLLAAKGGLVMVGDSTLCVGPSFGPRVHGHSAAAFGISPEEPIAIVGANVPPAPWVGWAVRPHHPAWDLAATTWNQLANAGPTSWSAAEARKLGEKLWLSQSSKNIQILQDAEGSRKYNGGQMTPEDFLQKQVNPLDPKTELVANTLYVAMDGDSLVRDYRYSWFVRLSREQILESNFYWAHLAKKHMSRLAIKK